jgi:hypothetical protein
MHQAIMSSLQHCITTVETKNSDLLILTTSLKKCHRCKDRLYIFWSSDLVKITRLHKCCEVNHPTGHSESCISMWFKVGELRASLVLAPDCPAKIG